jgi:hypothetical protein
MFLLASKVLYYFIQTTSINEQVGINSSSVDCGKDKLINFLSWCLMLVISVSRMFQDFVQPTQCPWYLLILRNFFSSNLLLFSSKFFV